MISFLFNYFINKNWMIAFKLFLKKFLLILRVQLNKNRWQWACPTPPTSRRSSSGPRCGWYSRHRPTASAARWSASYTRRTYHDLKIWNSLSFLVGFDYIFLKMIFNCIFPLFIQILLPFSPTFNSLVVYAPLSVRLKQPSRSPVSESAPHCKTIAFGW